MIRISPDLQHNIAPQKVDLDCHNVELTSEFLRRRFLNKVTTSAMIPTFHLRGAAVWLIVERTDLLGTNGHLHSFRKSTITYAVR